MSTVQLHKIAIYYSKCLSYSAGIGLLNRYPCATSQPIFFRKVNCPSSFTLFAMVFYPQSMRHGSNGLSNGCLWGLIFRGLGKDRVGIKHGAINTNPFHCRTLFGFNLDDTTRTATDGTSHKFLE